MFWLSTSTVVRLRDQLRAAGQKGMVSAAAATDPSEADLATLEAEYGPLCEAMYLMMSADGEIAREELDVLGGALRNLSGNVLDGDMIERLIDRAKASSEAHGRESRLREVIATLAEDKARAEVAFGKPNAHFSVSFEI